MIYRKIDMPVRGLGAMLPKGEGWIYHGDPWMPEITHPPDEQCEECLKSQRTSSTS